jgi:hypothetical protein
MPHEAKVINAVEPVAGDAHPSRDELIINVYNELRRLATAYLRRERADHTLQPTALVHEAYMRLTAQKGVDWRNREHFLACQPRISPAAFSTKRELECRKPRASAAFG